MNAPSENLVTDFRILMTDVEELAKATVGQSGEKLADLRERVKQASANLKPRLAQLEAQLNEKTKAAVAATDNYVHERPWTAIGLATGIGLIIGLLIGRR
jgi:ElaB/YqjD/DUF883 family membrane-anchored ribosome-binding protein